MPTSKVVLEKRLLNGCLSVLGHLPCLKILIVGKNLSEGLFCCETSWEEAAGMGHKGSAWGHGSCVVSTSGAEREPSAPDLVKQWEDSTAGVDELPVERHSSAAWRNDHTSPRWDWYTSTPTAVCHLTSAGTFLLTVTFRTYATTSISIRLSMSLVVCYYEHNVHPFVHVIGGLWSHSGSATSRWQDRLVSWLSACQSQPDRNFDPKFCWRRPVGYGKCVV